MNLGERIKAEREAQNLKQGELALLAGLKKEGGQQAVQALEMRGSTKSKHAPAVAAALGLRLEWALTGEGPKYASGEPRPTPARDVALAAGPVSASETRRVQQREGGWIGAKMTPAQQSLLRAVELMGRTIPDERAKALAELVLLSGGPVEAPPKVTA